MELPLYRAEITGKPLNDNLEYEPVDSDDGKRDEVEDMYHVLKHAVEDLAIKYGIKAEGVSSGAIRSTYQKNRVSLKIL